MTGDLGLLSLSLTNGPMPTDTEHCFTQGIGRVGCWCESRTKDREKSQGLVFSSHLPLVMTCRSRKVKGTGSNSCGRLHARTGGKEQAKRVRE